MTKENFLSKYCKGGKLNSIDFMKIWNHYDKDGSGFLEKAELDLFLCDLLQTYGGENPSEEMLSDYRTYVYENADFNKDGKIEIGEFSALMPVEENFMQRFSSRKTLTRKDFNEIFMHYDPDGNGFIEHEELLALIKDILSKESKIVTMKDMTDYRSAVLQVFDKNTDGRLSRKELGLLLSIDK